MSKQIATTKRFSTLYRRSLHTAVCILALMASAAFPAFSADNPGDKDFEKGEFAMEQGDTDTAIKFYTKAAEQGHAEAQNSLGVIYDGQGNVSEAFKWYKKSAEQGRADAQYSLGFCYLMGKGCEKNGEECVKWLQQSADQGFGLASATLGMLYETGTGVEKNNAEAAKWYQKALEGEEYEALNPDYKLGCLYEEGRGVQVDEKKALKLYKDAAKRGHKDAIYRVGRCYSRGIGVEENKFIAHEWLKGLTDWMIERANKNDYDAALTLADYKSTHAIVQRIDAENMDTSDPGRQGLLNSLKSLQISLISDIEKDAYEAYGFAAFGGGFPRAQYALAECHMNGIGTEKNEKEAVRMYRRAAEKGYADAQYRLAECYQNGKGVEKDQKEASKLYLMAADNGSIMAQWMFVNSLTDEKDIFNWLKKLASRQLAEGRDFIEKSAIVSAQYKLGKAYAEGNGTEEDEKEAFKWFKTASEQNRSDIMLYDAKKDITEAQINLGVFYEKGWGVDKNQEAAVNWYKKASEDSEFGKKANDALKRLGYSTDAPQGLGGFGGAR